MTKNSHIPRKSLNVLLRFMDPEERENFAGYIDAVYGDLVLSKGRRSARSWFWGQFVRSLPGLLANSIRGGNVMNKNYFKTALRAMRRRTAFSIINITGLTVGITCAILITLFIRNELSYDRFHENLGSIYRLITRIHNPDGSVRFQSESVHIPHGPALKGYFPGIERCVRTFPRTFVVKSGDLVENREILLADKEFFELFSFLLIKGRPAEVLSDPSSIVISEAYARKYLGEGDPVGKTLTLISGKFRNDYIVTGVAERVPANSSITFDLVVNFESLGRFGQASALNDWRTLWGGCRTYVQLQDDAAAATIEKGYPRFVKDRYAASFERERNSKFKGAAGNVAPLSFGLQGMKDAHLDPRALGAKKLSPVLILGGIALIILFIAGINFVTLSLGNASSRFNEVGIRKVVGAERWQLVRQYWIESEVLTGFALVFGIALAYLVLPVFNRLTLKSLQIGALLTPATAGFLIVMTLFLGLCVGSYPALALSRLHPVDILKGRRIFSGRSSFTRFLVILQFALSIFLVISTVVLGRQIHFMADSDLGFKRDQILIIKNIGGSLAYERLRNRLSPTPGILRISGALSSPVGPSNYTDITFKNKTYELIYLNYIDENYLPILDIEVLRGRNFSPEIASDRQAIVVNEALEKKFQLADPIGEMIDYLGERYAILGVVKDYHIEDKRAEIPPAIHFLAPGHEFSQMMIQFSPSELSRILADLRSAWKDLQPDRPLSYSFLDEDVEAQYALEKRWNRIVGYSSVMALLIAGLGVLGLATVTVNRRTKEIGIRKVCGASISGILVLLSRDLAKWVVLANLIAWPISYFAMNKWLQNYAYRTGLSVWIFILSGLAALAISLLAISFQTVKAATANPVNSLRYE